MSADDRQPHLPFGSPPASPNEGAGPGAIALALPLATAVGLFGVSFGVLGASEPSVGGGAAVVMSAITFGGSAQFAALSVLAAGGPPIAAITAAVLLNLRYLPIGVTVAPWLRGGPLRRFFSAQLIVDESWAVAARRDGRIDVRTLVIAGGLIWAAWVGGTALGVIGGSAIGDPNALGIDGALAALFLALLWPQLHSGTARVAALLGAGIALALIPVAPAGVPIIAAASAAFVGLTRR